MKYLHLFAILVQSFGLMTFLSAGWWGMALWCAVFGGYSWVKLGQIYDEETK